MTSPIAHMPQPILGAFNANSLEAINTAKDRDHIGGLLNRIFEQIKDWFSGTHVYEAKQCLYDILSDQSSDQQKYTSFTRLGKLAGEGFADRFILEETGTGSEATLSLKISIDEHEFSVEVNRNAAVFKDLQPAMNQERVLANLKEDAKKELDGMFEKDITRHADKTYKVNGQELQTYTTQGFESLARQHQFADTEIETVKKIAHQGGLAIVMIEGGQDLKVDISKGDTNWALQLDRNANGDATLMIKYDSDSFSTLASLEEIAEHAATLDKHQMEPTDADPRGAKTFGAGTLKLEVTISASGEITAAKSSMTLSQYIGPPPRSIS